MDTTTTDTGTEDTGVATATEPVVTATDEAATQPAEPQTTAEQPAEPSEDDNSAWLKSKGISLDDADWQDKVIANARQAEKLMSKSTAKASELQKSLTTNLKDPVTTQPDAITRLAEEVQGLKLAQSVNGFFTENPDAKAFEPAMADIVNTRPEIGQLVKAGYLGVADLYQLAKGGDPTIIDNAKSQGGKEALQQLASKQQAKAVTGVATTSALTDDTKEDAFLKGLSSAS